MTKAREIAKQALGHQGKERDSYLESACGDDLELRQEVERLLDAQETRLKAPTIPGPHDTADHPAIAGLERETGGDTIGHYQLMQKIGEGGFGTVWMAQQRAPVKRRVALKIIKLGMDTKEVIARFDAERQALALLDHPHIAKVFDAGSTDTGRPYFVMELVKGVPILEYCDRARLDTRRRLELFIKVCQAIQHAHQKGVIHRDIKPGNILVTVQEGAPVPKVIDFGIAKATNTELTQKSFFTEYHQLIGTPAYMSPEQAEMTGLDIDTRSDIYSLGVLLYELLTGTTPFDINELLQKGFAEMMRALCEIEPPKPSTRVSSLGKTAHRVAEARRAEVRHLSMALHGDLDWIVMKCLEKDRTRRYETANGLAEDVRRHLEHQPVTAGPPSAVYRVRKFVRRNRTVVAAASVAVAALILGVVGTTWGLVRSMQEQARTVRALQELEQVSEFQASQLAGIDTRLMGERLRDDISARQRAALEQRGLDSRMHGVVAAELEHSLEAVSFTNVALTNLEVNIFQRALDAIGRDFAEQPLVKARLLQTVASTLLSLGLLEGAVAPQAEALETRRRILGNDHPDTLRSAGEHAELLREQGKFAEAEPLFREAMEGRRRVVGDEHPDTLAAIGRMGSLLQAQGKLDEAELFFREALDGRRRELGNEHPDTLASLRDMASLLQDQGKHAEAEPFLHHVLEVDRRILGDDDPRTLHSINNLGLLLQELGKFNDAEPLLRESLDGTRRHFGDVHPRTLAAATNMALVLNAQGKFAEAEVFFREVLDSRRRALGGDHPSTLLSANNLGMFFLRQGDFVRAEPMLREALEGCRRTLGAQHPQTLGMVNNMGMLFSHQGRFADAEPYYREALNTSRVTLGEDHPQTLILLNNMAMLYRRQERFSEAERSYRQAFDGFRRVFGEDHPNTIISLINLGGLLRAQGRYEEVSELLGPFEETTRRVFGDGDVLRLASFLTILGRSLVGTGESSHLAAAEQRLIEAHRIFVTLHGGAHSNVEETVHALITLYEGRHAAEPGGGFDAKAAEWRARVDTGQ